MVPTLEPSPNRRGGAGAGPGGDRAGQAALDIVAIGHRAVEGQVAVIVIGRRGPAHRRILVEVIGGVTGRARGRGIEQPAIVADRLTDPAIVRVIAVGERHPGLGRRGLRDRRRPAHIDRAIERIIAVGSAIAQLDMLYSE